MMLRTTIALLVITTVTVTLGHAAEIKIVDTENGGTIVSLTGEIVPGDQVKFLDTLEPARSNRPVKALRLNSPGGSIREAVNIAGIVRANNIQTSVGTAETCASACFIIFTAGVRKYAALGAMIGVHSAWDRVTGKDAPAGTIAVARIIRELGVPEAIVGKLVLAGPDEVSWLSGDDLSSMGVLQLGLD
jgi:hypothetical protein